MATTTTITKLLFRRGNDSDRKQTILASGEPGFTLDTKRLFIGDGITPGGVPALSAREDHLHYVDQIPGDQRWTEVEKHDTGGHQFLDLNIPGLAKTLAGDNSIDEQNQRWFHPVRDHIQTTYDMYFNDEDAEIVHTGSGPFTIRKSSQAASLGEGNSEGNTLNLWDALYIKRGSNGDTYVEVNVDTVAWRSAAMIFDGQSTTHFEDNTIDLNVVYTDADKTAPAPANSAGTRASNSSGLYFSHYNNLSAGYMRVGSVNTEQGMSTFELQPPVYLPNWESRSTNGYIQEVTQRTPPSDSEFFTTKFQGTLSDYADGFRGSKPLIINSVRPEDGNYDFRGREYSGDAHFFFEAGLIVYDSGGADTGSYNAYKLNQSVDTRAVPQFAGLVIEDEDGNPGAPIPVYSGGTGVASFNRGSILFTTGKHTDDVVIKEPGSDTGPDPLEALPIEQGDLIIGTDTKGVVKSKLATSEWVTIDYSEGTGSGMNGRSDGIIRVNNTFAPDYLNTNTDTRLRWFAKFSSFIADSGNITATGTSEDNPSEYVTFRGDYTGTEGGWIRTTTADSGINNRSIKFAHNPVASELFSRGSGTFSLDYTREDGERGVVVNTIFAGNTSDDRYLDGFVPSTATDALNNTSADYVNKGYVTAGVLVDQAGHIIGMRSRDLDDRYPQMFDLGTGWKEANNQSPLDLAEQVNTGSDIGSTVTETDYLTTDLKSAAYTADTNTRVMTGIEFNKYGTVSGYVHHNLQKIFYDKTQISCITDTIDGRLNGHDAYLATLDDATFKRNANTYTDRRIETGWFNSSEIQFSSQAYASNVAHNKIYATAEDWHFKPHGNSSTSFYVPRSRDVEWRRLAIGGGDSDASDSNDASERIMRVGVDSSDNTLFDLYYDNQTRFSFSGGNFEYKSANGTTVTKINTSGIETGALVTNNDITIKGGDLFIESTVPEDPNLRTSDIHFKDRNSNTWRTLQWHDFTNEFKIEANDGNMYPIIHTGNAESYLLNQLGFEELFVNAAGDSMTGDLNMASNRKIKTSRIDTANDKQLIINVGESAGKVSSALQADEMVYINTEYGLEVNTPDDAHPAWKTGYSVKKATIKGDKGHFGNNRIYADDYHPIADRFSTNMKLSLAGDATGSVSFDGLTDAVLTVAIKDDSHNHIIGNIDGLSSRLNGIESDITSLFGTYLPLAGGTMTGKLNAKNIDAEHITATALTSEGDAWFARVLNFNFNLPSNHWMTLQTGSAVANMMHNGANDSRTINEMKLWSYVNLSDSDGDNTQLNVQGYIYARQGMQSDNNVYFTKDCRVFDTLYVGGDGRGDSTIAFYDDNSNTWRALRWDDSSNTFTIEDNANQQKAVIHSGNYGSYLGDVYAPKNHSHAYLPTAGGTVTGNLTVNGTIYGKKDIIAYHSSDVKFKDNLKPIDNALEKTLSLTGYEFDWNDKQQTHEGHDVGVVAQEVEKVIPEIVNTDEEDNKSVRYEKLVPLLIQSIKELSEQVEQLKSKLK